MGLSSLANTCFIEAVAVSNLGHEEASSSARSRGCTSWWCPLAVPDGLRAAPRAWAPACSRARWGELCNAPWPHAPRPLARAPTRLPARACEVAAAAAQQRASLCVTAAVVPAFAIPRFRAPCQGRGKTEGARQRRPSEGGAAARALRRGHKDTDEARLTGAHGGALGPSTAAHTQEGAGRS